jgi:hypothetical protein
VLLRVLLRQQQSPSAARCDVAPHNGIMHSHTAGVLRLSGLRRTIGILRVATAFSIATAGG